MLADALEIIVRLALVGGIEGQSAAAAAPAAWPDSVDTAALVAYAVVAFGLPVLGYCVMAVDIRRYLRSMRRALVVVVQAASPSAPYWSARGRPPCLQALDLDLPCTEEQVLSAYRRQVKQLHPDRGGDLRQFLRLQKHFEQAMYLARTHSRRR